MSGIGRGGLNSARRAERPAPIVILEVLSRFVPAETIRAVLARTGRHSRRIRRLPACTTRPYRIGRETTPRTHVNLCPTDKPQGVIGRLVKHSDHLTSSSILHIM